MAIKKISYDLNGKIKEIASSSVNYDDVAGKLTINKMSFSTASVGTGDGLLSTSAGGTLSASAGLNDGDIICWSTSSNKWITRGDTYDLIALGTAPIGDLTGSTYSNALVKSLSNVSSGTLQVANGGTGLTTAQVTALGTGSALLIGHGAGAMTLIRDNDVGDLSKKPVLSANADGTGWSYITQSAPQSNVDVQVFSTTGSFNWYKPANTKMIRVLAQGAGGGGGSGANRNSAVAALGGAGGAAGAFVDSGLFQIDDSFLTASVVVGAGGAGAVYPVTGTAGFAGFAGGLSSFGSASSGPYFAANGGLGGGSGSLGTSVTSSGGASVTASSNVYDIVTYNNAKILNTSLSGSRNSTTAGINNSYNDIGNYYYGDGGGASGGSLISANYTTNYNGGNADSTLALFNFENTLADAASDLTLGYSNYLAVGATQATFTTQDKKFGSYSLKCSGSYADYYATTLTGPGSSIGTGNFTFEFWLKLNSYTSGNGGAIITFSVDGPSGVCSVSSAGVLYFSNATTNIVIPLGSWIHIAFVRIGTTVYTYINGVLSGTTIAHSVDYTTISTLTRFGYYYSSNQMPLNGYIDSFKASNVALYTSNFIPPTKQANYINNKGTTSSLNALPAVSSSATSSIGSFTYPQDIFVASGGGGGASAAITGSDVINLSLNPIELYHMNSLTTEFNKSVTLAGTTSLTNTGKFNNTSLSFTSGQAVINTTAVNAIGTGNYTIECWVYVNSYQPTADGVGNASFIFDTNNTSGGRPYVSIGTTGQIQYNHSPGINGSINLGLNQWYHVAISRQSGTVRLFVDGQLAGSVTDTVNFSTFTSKVTLGKTWDNAALPLNGYIDEFAIFSYAKYTAAFTPPSAEYTVTAVQNSYPGGLGGNGAWGSGGGGGGASTNLTGSLVGTRQGGNGGDGYVTVISYKDF